jgi:archaeal flagellin FlaB
MEKKYMERLVGKYCKIVTKEPGEDRASVVTGVLEDVDYKDGFILVDSDQGLGCLRINTIVAIKPGRKRPEQGNKNIKKDVKAFVGIGTLIVFIAMILIAAVAASVLITTSEHLQRRAQSVGMNTIREVSSGLVIDDIVGYTNDAKTRIEYIAFQLRPRAGSQDFDMELLTLTMLYDELHVTKFDSTMLQNVNLDNKSVFFTPESAGSSTWLINLTNTTSFATLAIHDYDSSIMNTYGMNDGDRALLIINATALIPSDNGLATRKTISGEVRPETGAGGIYEITTPAVYSERVVDLW